MPLNNENMITNDAANPNPPIRKPDDIELNPELYYRESPNREDSNDLARQYLIKLNASGYEEAYNSAEQHIFFLLDVSGSMDEGTNRIHFLKKLCAQIIENNPQATFHGVLFSNQIDSFTGFDATMSKQKINQVKAGGKTDVFTSWLKCNQLMHHVRQEAKATNKNIICSLYWITDGDHNATVKLNEEFDDTYNIPAKHKGYFEGMSSFTTLNETRMRFLGEVYREFLFEEGLYFDTCKCVKLGEAHVPFVYLMQKIGASDALFELEDKNNLNPDFISKITNSILKYKPSGVQMLMPMPTTNPLRGQKQNEINLLLPRPILMDQVNQLIESAIFYKCPVQKKETQELKISLFGKQNSFSIPLIPLANSDTTQNDQAFNMALTSDIVSSLYLTGDPSTKVGDLISSNLYDYLSHDVHYYSYYQNLPSLRFLQQENMKVLPQKPTTAQSLIKAEKEKIIQARTNRLINLYHEQPSLLEQPLEDADKTTLRIKTKDNKVTEILINLDQKQEGDMFLDIFRLIVAKKFFGDTLTDSQLKTAAEWHYFIGATEINERNFKKEFGVIKKQTIITLVQPEPILPTHLISQTTLLQPQKIFSQCHVLNKLLILELLHTIESARLADNSHIIYFQKLLGFKNPSRDRVFPYTKTLTTDQKALLKEQIATNVQQILSCKELNGLSMNMIILYLNRAMVSQPHAFLAYLDHIPISTPDVFEKFIRPLLVLNLFFSACKPLVESYLGKSDDWDIHSAVSLGMQATMDIILKEIKHCSLMSQDIESAEELRMFQEKIINHRFPDWRACILKEENVETLKKYLHYCSISNIETASIKDLSPINERTASLEKELEIERLKTEIENILQEDIGIEEKTTQGNKFKFFSSPPSSNEVSPVLNHFFSQQI